ncbi:hypothetical protein [Saccharothrix longispora]|uniref:hypothetical protein n=1 Tax=Saccharothrix longispora TaxID=33920 RepID=UPI0028FD3C96|nr:hypothetical protein [Saccharothrix longispora]MDU0290382.1 hypothetical protein [Saccharothrix longispora]
MHSSTIAIGSHGDVAPSTGLGARLRDEEHRVAVATHALHEVSATLPPNPWAPRHLRAARPAAALRAGIPGARAGRRRPGVRSARHVHPGAALGARAVDRAHAEQRSPADTRHRPRRAAATVPHTPTPVIPKGAP